ncbi:hypothetical protein XAC3562_1930005 [Xanthomonas citri pv. citri]|uniref:Uncharacterized protein n=1 Tax=Xanthomonas citri pv. citri TaxID=611301 RepID=A0A0U5FEM1_XANCI|nr:hypothetical protein XACS584_1850007 [Xanthomonas citri pv. citri]CEE62734.1 hypothetical protein XAC3608_2000006 [Xanthomonas citri pv. citri]CEG15375.1 hypothetical protein XAC3562_1930005 [Xanthomonas citri pv. citri]CEI00652.1 hypothetical protein XACG117_2620005 [Xanthomonas citri pv. citri]CEI36461.1 hypothetical protein XACJJ10_1920005 [Xanthomonas citri pv. citri]
MRTCTRKQTMWHIRRAESILAKGCGHVCETQPQAPNKKSRPEPGLNSNVQPLIKRGLTVGIVAAVRL